MCLRARNSRWWSRNPNFLVSPLGSLWRLDLSLSLSHQQVEIGPIWNTLNHTRRVFRFECCPYCESVCRMIIIITNELNIIYMVNSVTNNDVICVFPYASLSFSFLYFRLFELRSSWLAYANSASWCTTTMPLNYSCRFPRAILAIWIYSYHYNIICITRTS